MSTGDRGQRILSDIILGGMDAWVEEAKRRAEMSREILARYEQQKRAETPKGPRPPSLDDFAPDDPGLFE